MRELNPSSARQGLRLAATKAVHLVPAPVALRCVPLLRAVERFEISARAVEFVRDSVRPGSLVLVFGVGRDSATWELVNRRGRTAFVEDLPEWVEFSRAQSGRREVHPIAYTTAVASGLGYAHIDEVPIPHLPEAVTSDQWDIVIVDGPKGAAPHQPGRASSIALAAQLVTSGGLVLIDDYDRPLEQHACRLAFGRAPDQVLDPARPVAVYRV